MNCPKKKDMKKVKKAFSEKLILNIICDKNLLAIFIIKLLSLSMFIVKNVRFVKRLTIF